MPLPVKYPNTFSKEVSPKYPTDLFCTSRYKQEFSSYHCHSREELGYLQFEPLWKMQSYPLKPTWPGLEDLKTKQEKNPDCNILASFLAHVVALYHSYLCICLVLPWPLTYQGDHKLIMGTIMLWLTFVPSMTPNVVSFLYRVRAQYI